MAVPNMIVTLVANTTKYANGLRRAAKDTQSFGDFARKGFGIAASAVVAVGAALAKVVPVLANMGAESRRADVQLKFMLENMQGISAATNATIGRMSKYATSVAKSTGIDDEQVKAVQKKILVFKSLRKTADELGGTFDRTTMAAIDLASAGFGDMETNAVKLGRMLEDPIKNLNAMNRAGITFNESEQKKIKALVQSGQLLKAQDVVLKSIENRVGGLAEKSATPFEKMNQQFQEMGDTIGAAMLPELEDMNRELSKWLSSKSGKEDLKQIAEAFVNIAKAINMIVGAILDVRDAWKQATKQADNYNSRFYSPNAPTSPRQLDKTGPTTPADRRPTGIAPVTINFNTPVDSVSAGREIQRVLSDYNRASGRG